jgi:hypothetical protein
LLETLLGKHPNPRMNDRLEQLAFAGVVEDYSRESRTIESAIRKQHIRSEFADNLAQPLRAFGNGLTGQYIGVYFDRAELDPAGRNCAFSGCDATG